MNGALKNKSYKDIIDVVQNECNQNSEQYNVLKNTIQILQCTLCKQAGLNQYSYLKSISQPQNLFKHVFINHYESFKYY